MNDEYIISIFWPNIQCLLKRRKKLLTPEIEQYLQQRFKKSESYFETLYCIKHNIDRDNVKCPICGGDIRFRGGSLKTRGPFLNGCSKECQIIYRNLHSQQTCLKKYGCKSPRQNKEKNDEINEKRRKTCLEKYGVDMPNKSEIIKEKTKNTCLEKYGCEYVFQSEEVKEKIHQTCLTKYNTDWTFQNDLAKQHQKETLMKKYGVENSFLIPDVVESVKQRKNEIQQKRNVTKRKNKTFGTSIPENKSYNLLIDKFGLNNIIRQYYSELYPYNCDFYIITLDLYIECNYFWTHQGHFFDKNSESDISLLKILVERAKTSTFYKGVIDTWTEKDIQKLNTAKRNNLNYLVFWSINELENWLNNYEENN